MPPRNCGVSQRWQKKRDAIEWAAIRLGLSSPIAGLHHRLAARSARMAADHVAEHASQGVRCTVRTRPFSHSCTAPAPHHCYCYHHHHHRIIVIIMIIISSMIVVWMPTTSHCKQDRVRARFYYFSENGRGESGRRLAARPARPAPLRPGRHSFT